MMNARFSALAPDRTRDPDAPFALAGRRVYPRRNEIQTDGERRRVEPRHMKVLVRLARAGGETVGRADLLDAAWGDTNVGDDSLTQAVSHLRRALDDRRGGARIIETIPKTGYRLTAMPRPLGAGALPGLPARLRMPALPAGSIPRPALALLGSAVIAAASAVGYRASETLFAAPDAARMAQGRFAIPLPEALRAENDEDRYFLMRYLDAPGATADGMRRLLILRGHRDPDTGEMRRERRIIHVPETAPAPPAARAPMERASLTPAGRARG